MYALENCHEWAETCKTTGHLKVPKNCSTTASKNYKQHSNEYKIMSLHPLIFAS